ncbi:MAG: hypothetical protein ACTH7L_01705 [Psychrobacter alimentarius]
MSTNQLSPEKMHRSRNMQSDILHAVAETKQVNIAKHFGVESSTVGRWLDSKNPDSQMVRFCDMLAICGLKIVDANAQCYNKEKIDILFHITKYHFQNLEAVDDFFQNDAGMSDSNSMRFSRAAELSELNSTPNLVARFYAALKNLFTKQDVSSPTLLVAVQNIDAEMQQERQDKESDEAFFWKLICIVLCIAAVTFILSTVVNAL